VAQLYRANTVVYGLVIPTEMSKIIHKYTDSGKHPAPKDGFEVNDVFDLAKQTGGEAQYAEHPDQIFPEMKSLVGVPQEPEWHPEGDVWVHTLQVVDQARTRIADLPKPQAVTIMLGALAHDLGKPATTAFIDGRIRSIDHEEQGVPPATAFLDRLNIYTIDGYDVRHQVLGMTAHHLKPGMWFKVRDEVGDGAFRRLAQKVDLELLARLAKSDCLGRQPGTFNCEAMDWFLQRARTLGVEHRPPGPILLGRHLLELGMRPGPAMGEILKAVYEQQLDGKVTDLESAMVAARALLQ